MNNTGKILVAFASGAAMGALMGVLFAPHKGSKTRNKVREQGTKIVEDVEAKLNKGKEKLEHLRADFERKVTEERNKKMMPSES